MRATQLKSGTCIEIVARNPGAVHMSSGWPAFAGHDTVRVNIQGRWYDSFAGPPRGRYFSPSLLFALQQGKSFAVGTQRG
jgi:hypothetical protein